MNNIGEKYVNGSSVIKWVGKKYVYIEGYRGGLEYTTDEWNNPHPKIGAHSEGAFIRHPHCYIRSGYCQRVQATRNPSYVMAKGVSTALS